MALDYIVEKSQSTAFSAQRAVAYTGEVGVTVELSTVEHSHNADIFHVAILHNGVKNDFTVQVNVLQLVPCYSLQKLRHRENSPCAEPATHVVARYVVEHRVVRYLEDVVLQLLQIAHTQHLCMCLRIAEDEISEAHVLLHNVAQVDTHGLRVLVYEMKMLRFSLRPVGSLAALEYQRHVLILLTDGTEQL